MAEAEPRATRKPIVKGSELTSKAAFEAIKRFDGPVKGIMFRRKEVSRTPSSS